MMFSTRMLHENNGNLALQNAFFVDFCEGREVFKMRITVDLAPGLKGKSYVYFVIISYL